jgi:hypothetical protein
MRPVYVTPAVEPQIGAVENRVFAVDPRPAAAAAISLLDSVGWVEWVGASTEQHSPIERSATTLPVPVTDRITRPGAQKLHLSHNRANELPHGTEGATRRARKQKIGRCCVLCRLFRDACCLCLMPCLSRLAMTQRGFNSVKHSELPGCVVEDFCASVAVCCRCGTHEFAPGLLHFGVVFFQLDFPKTGAHGVLRKIDSLGVAHTINACHSRVFFNFFVMALVARSNVDVKSPPPTTPTTVQATPPLGVTLGHAATGDNSPDGPMLAVAESPAHGQPGPKSKSAASVRDPTPESAHRILEALFEGNSAPLVRAMQARLMRLQRTDLQVMNEIALKMLFVAIVHEALEECTEAGDESKQEAKDECAEAKHTGVHDAAHNRFRYHLQSEPAAKRWHAEQGCEKLGFIDLVIERTDTRAPRSSDSDRTVMTIELKYLPLTCWITDPSAGWFERQYFMRPVQQGIELERRKALHLAWDESTFRAQRFQRLDSGNTEFKRLAGSSAFDAVTCTQSKTGWGKDACTLPVSAWLELARLQAASYRLRQAPTPPIVRWAITAVGARVVADLVDVPTEPPAHVPFFAVPSSSSASTIA